MRSLPIRGLHKRRSWRPGSGVCIAMGIAALGPLACVRAQQDAAAAVAPVTYEAVTIPMAEAGSAGLAAMIVTPRLPGPHPLVLLTPGSTFPDKDPARELREVGPGRLLPEATWFARRGWEVAIVLRRGFGASGGPLADDLLHVLPYTAAAIAQVETINSSDLRVAYASLVLRPEVDGTRVIAVGDGTGGTSAMWLAEPPQAATTAHVAVPLRAVINFSGGWPTVPDYRLQGRVHGIPDVVEPAFRVLGASAKVPMLWIYPEAGSEFGLKSAVAARLAFTSAGGDAQMRILTHAVDKGPDKAAAKETALFDLDPAEWGPWVEQFLERLGLPSRVLLPEAKEPLLSELPDEYPDVYLDDAKRGYLQYLRRGPCKAFVHSPHGDWAYATGKASVRLAEQDALKACGRGDCIVKESVP